MTPDGWLVRDGLRLAYYRAGDGPRAVVFQHGLCGDARQTAEAMPQVAGYRSLTLECRGHGASEPGAAFSIASFAGDVAALIETGAAPVVLGGISMGAAIACQLAVRRPDLVRALILVRPAWGTEPAPENMRPNAEVGALLARLPAAEAEALFRQSATAARLATGSPDNLASLNGFFARRPQSETARLLVQISGDGPGITEADLRALRVPVLICGAAEDAIHPLALARHLASLIPRARLVELPAKGRDKAAHIAALHAAISLFLQELQDAETQP
jgi:pimeloyl-ACP methyl ester carboxylesterase